MDRIEELLKELTEAFGISGYESDVAEIMAKRLKQYGEVSYDKLGSVICKKLGESESPKVMIAAHMDEVGFMVERITKNGYIKFLPLGGWWSHTILGQRVIVRTSKSDVVGVVGAKPVHLLKEEEKKKILPIEDMYIDVGATSDFDIKEKLGIKPGDPVIPYSPFTVMKNSKLYLSKAWDDRVGCGLLVEILKNLSKVKHPNTVYGVGTVQEEVGLRGAQTSGMAVEPDIAFALDVSICKDAPGNEEEAEEKLGAGASILVYDRTMIPNLRLRDLVVEIAEKGGMKYHFGTVKGGYDTGRIHLIRSGVPSLVIGVPTRYIHSHSGIISRGDFNSIVNLIVEVIKRLNKKTVAKLTM